MLNRLGHWLCDRPRSSRFKLLLAAALWLSTLWPLVVR